MYNQDEKTNQVPENQPGTPVTPTDPEQERDRKKKLVGFIFYSIMLILVFTFIYFLFFKKKDAEPGSDALQTDLPAPAERHIGPKAKEYESVSGLKFFDPASDQSLEEMFDEAIGSDKKKKNTTTVEDKFMEESNKNSQMLDNLLNHLDNLTQETNPSPALVAVHSPVDSFPTAATVAAVPDNSEIKELKKEIAAIKLQQKKDDVTQRLVAAATGAGTPSIGDTAKKEQERPRTPVLPVKRGNRRDVVSSLSAAPRRTGFYGFGTTETAEKNTIKAVTYGKQVIENGQHVRVRTSEAMQVGGQILPAGSILTGIGTVAVDRLYITFETVEYDGVLTHVSMEAYDADGQRGLFVPGSMEMDAIRELGVELATAMGQTASQSFSVIGNSQSAAEELKKDLGQGAIQGVSRFAAKKLARVRITIQDGHNILLVPAQQ